MTAPKRASRLPARELDRVQGGAQDIRVDTREKRSARGRASAAVLGFHYNSDTEAT